MGAHADFVDEIPLNCPCEWALIPGTLGWGLFKLKEECPLHGRPENLADDATRRQREISERKWA